MSWAIPDENESPWGSCLGEASDQAWVFPPSSGFRYARCLRIARFCGPQPFHASSRAHLEWRTVTRFLPTPRLAGRGGVRVGAASGAGPRCEPGGLAIDLQRRYDICVQHRESGFTAQYDSGTCTNCGESIEAGQEIADSGYGGRITRYHHVPFCPGAHITCSICGENWYECDCP